MTWASMAPPQLGFAIGAVGTCCTRLVTWRCGYASRAPRSLTRRKSHGVGARFFDGSRAAIPVAMMVGLNVERARGPVLCAAYGIESVVA
jgi:hypothetical protein